MTSIQYDLFISAHLSNLNGDPHDGGRPRQDRNGFGLASVYCIKRKLRKAAAAIVSEYPDKYDPNRFGIFLSTEDGLTKDDKIKEVEKVCGNKDKCEYILEHFWDARLLGSLFNMKNESAIQRSTGLSVSVSETIEPIDIYDMPITSSVPHTRKPKKAQKRKRDEEDDEDEVDDEKNMSDTGRMGTVGYVENALYHCFLYTSPLACKRNGVDERDIELLEHALKYLFCNDASTTRPTGSLVVKKLVKVEHPSSICNASSVVTATHKDGQYIFKIDTDKIKANNCKMEEII